MSDCFDYLFWRGDISFSEKPINEVDGMILARLSYAPFELVGETKAQKVGAICHKLLQVENLKENLVQQDDGILIEALSRASRFSGLYMLEYVNKIDLEDQTQFSAVTFEIGRGLYYIAFRGTDDTLVGWKENFNMSFERSVPAQQMAVEYFRHIAKKVRGKFILGGHSKGGNLAVFAAAFAEPQIQKKILAVCNYDGPGFETHVLKEKGYLAIKDRIHTYIPQSSVVGLLLFHETEYTIVKSSYNGLLQHDTYSWEVDKTKFVYLEKITEKSKFLDSTLKEWIAGMDTDNREKLVNTLYHIISETGARTVTELSENWVSNSISVIKTLRGLDEGTRKVLTEALYALAKGAGKVFSEKVKSI